MSVGIVANVYREPFAMPGWLKMATRGYFDDVAVISSPPSGAKADEETLELVKAAGVRLIHTTIDRGFGVVRTRCIRESKADWVFISDADEEFSPIVPLITCEGTEGYPQFKKPKLTVTHGEPWNQGEWMKQQMATTKANAIRLSRRHWFDAPGLLKKPCQNWHTIPDWQLRWVRNSPFTFYDPEYRMHEKILDSRTWSEPTWVSGDVQQGPFVDHHHCYYKPMEPENNREDAATYEKLDKGVTADMWLNGAAGVTP